MTNSKRRGIGKEGFPVKMKLQQNRSVYTNVYNYI